MATEMITLKLEDTFLREIDTVVEKSGYQNRTEFIRNTLREKLEDVKLQQALLDLAQYRGSSSKKTSDADIERVRSLIAKKFKK